MHLKRWITSIVVLPLLALLIYRGQPLLFTLFILIVCIFALWEYFRIVAAWGENIANTDKASTKHASKPLPTSFKALTFIFSALILWAAHQSALNFIPGLIAFNLLIAALIAMVRFKSNWMIVESITKLLLGIVYIPVCLSYMVLIRNGTGGVYWTFLLLSVIFAGDTCAYYIGSFWGRHKLCPAISPGKTVEGAIGGLGANMVAGAFWKIYFLPGLSWAPGLVFFLLLGVAGQIGDLFESVIKRVANVKDSGVIMPGHGGICDRIDALLFAAPLAYYFKVYMV